MKRRRYVIMANGRGMRWGNYLGIPKHLISVDDETLIQRIVRQVRERDPKADVVISSSDPLLETEGARRHAPERNEIELDRFAPELVNDAVTFLYGDTFYTAAAMDKIISSTGAPMQFYGDARSIVAVEVNDGLTMLAHLHNVRSLFLAGEISACVGWQVYQSYNQLPFGPPAPHDSLYWLGGLTTGFNTPEDFLRFQDWHKAHESEESVPGSFPEDPYLTPSTGD